MTHNEHIKKKVKKAKQVIVVRKDIEMPQGKIAAQVAHASLTAITNRGYVHDASQTLSILLTDAMMMWFKEEFTKVVVYVKSEQELKDIYEKALTAGLPCSLTKDAGHTVFKGTLTYTACAVGPAFEHEVNIITGHLKLV